jgi:translation initiation factor 1A
MEEELGDFEEISEGQELKTENSEGYTRVRTPRGKELIGVIVQRLGGNRMEVATTDGKTRNCRVPGRFKRTLWLRPNDVVLIQPWEDDNEKGDVIFKYNSSAITQLKKRGILDKIKTGF